MKKLFLLTAAFASMLFASCQKEEVAPTANETTVTYTVEIPDVQVKSDDTKAIGDGFNVDELVYEVWKTEVADETDLMNPAKATRLYQKTARMVRQGDQQRTTISLNLVQDQEYTILFWAQNAAADAYNTEVLTNVRYSANATAGDYISNREDMAAFYGVDYVSDGDPKAKTVYLKRPFAQLNLGTKNTATDYKVTVNTTEVFVENVPMAFNVATKTSSENVGKFWFSHGAVPGATNNHGATDATIKVNDQTYEWAAMNYMFATNGGQTATVKYAIATTLTSTNLDGSAGATTDALVTNIVENVPLKENYRTNIVGNLLTSTTDYEVVIDARWDDVNDPNWDGRVEEVWDQKYVQEPPMVNGAYEISLASELAWLAAQVNAKEGAKKFSGVTFKLVEDIDFNDPNFVGGEELLWNPIGATGRFEGIFDGQNHTISNLKVKTEGTTPAGLFGRVQSGTVKNVKVVNANIEGHASAAVIVAHGVCAKISNCRVQKATVISTPYNKDEANNIGAIAGFLGADGGAASLTECTVNDAVITAYRKVGGVVGAANQAAVVTGNSVENIRVTADQTAEYKEVKAADLGAIAGFIHAQATVAENSEEEVTLIHKVNSVDEMQNPAAGAQVILSAGEYNIQEDVKFDAAIQITDGDASVYSENNTITTGNDVNYGFITKGENSSLVFDANVNFNGGGFGATDGSQITINGGSVAVNATTTNPRYNIYAVGNGTTVTINDGNFSISKLTLKRAYIYAGAGATVYVKGGTFGKASSRSGYTAGILGEGNVIITGGTFGFNPTKWVAVGYTAKKVDNNWVVVSLSQPEELEAAVSIEGATVNMAAGEYTFPSSKIAAGVTINCEEGTVFTGASSLNIKGATVIGATFSNPSGSAVSSTINGTFKDCTFEGSNAFRYCYAGETVVFENCVFSGSTYGVHFDGGENEILFKNCTFSGFNAFAAATPLVTFDGCSFKSNGKSGYNGANLWGSAKLINTTFVFDGSVANEWIDMIGADKSYEMTGCTINGGSIFNPEKIFSRNPGTKINVDGVHYTWAEGGYLIDENGNVPTSSAEVMQSAVNSGANVTINLLNDIAGNVTVPQNADVKVIINGNNKKYNGLIVVDGKSATYSTAGLVIKDLIFNASAISADACIRLGDGTNNTRYTCNVTVDNCVFDVPGAVGVKSYTGGDKNLVITGCTATVNAHSLIQAKGIDNILVEKCTVNSKNGMNFNNSVNVTINECNADVKGYAARFGEGSATNGAAEVYTIKNSTLKSACEDGDAVIILRGTADNSTLTIENTTIEGTTKIANNAVNANVIEK